MFAIDLDNTPVGLFSFLVLGSAVKLTALGWLRRRRGQRFQCVGRVHALYSYPVKSFAGLQLSEADAGVLGLEYKGTLDRHWMVTRDGHMLSTKTEGRLLLISPKPLGQGRLRLDAPDMPSLTLDMDPSRIVSCRIYGTDMSVVDCGDEVAGWLTTFLQAQGGGEGEFEGSLRLVYSPPHLAKREAVDNKVPWDNNTRLGDQIAFSYMASYMLTSASSLHDLNQRLSSPISMMNFRPNIVIEGTPPYDEDNWEEVRIGESLHLRLVDVCRRCPIINIDPATGRKRPDHQPLQKLKTYRCIPPYGNSPLFGVYAAVEAGGHIRVGDKVEVIRRRVRRPVSMHLYDGLQEH